MAIRGEKFLEVTRATDFKVSYHALNRIFENTRNFVSEENALGCFSEARQIRYPELLLRGFHPGFNFRQRMGVKTWYFRFELEGQELISVIGEGEEKGEFIWVTTFGMGFCHSFIPLRWAA